MLAWRPGRMFPSLCGAPGILNGGVCRVPWEGSSCTGTSSHTSSVRLLPVWDLSALHGKWCVTFPFFSPPVSCVSLQPSWPCRGKVIDRWSLNFWSYNLRVNIGWYWSGDCVQWMQFTCFFCSSWLQRQKHSDQMGISETRNFWGIRLHSDCKTSPGSVNLHKRHISRGSTRIPNSALSTSPKHGEGLSIKHWTQGDATWVERHRWATPLLMSSGAGEDVRLRLMECEHPRAPVTGEDLKWERVPAGPLTRLIWIWNAKRAWLCVHISLDRSEQRWQLCSPSVGAHALISFTWWYIGCVHLDLPGLVWLIRERRQRERGCCCPPPPRRSCSFTRRASEVSSTLSKKHASCGVTGFWCDWQ